MGKEILKIIIDVVYWYYYWKDNSYSVDILILEFILVAIFLTKQQKISSVFPLLVEREAHIWDREFCTYLSSECLEIPKVLVLAWNLYENTKIQESICHIELPFIHNKEQMAVKMNSCLDSINFIDLIMIWA